MQAITEQTGDHPTSILVSMALLGFVYAVQQILLYVTFKIGLDHAYLSLGVVVLVAGAICFSPLLLPARLQSKSVYVVLAILGAVLCAALAYLSAVICLMVYIALFAWGAVRMLCALTRFNRQDVFCILLLATAFSVHTLLKSNEFTNLPYGIFMQELSSIAFLGRDAYFHAAIITMLDKYHAVSLGIGGLDTINYHYGFHLLAAAWMKLSGLPVMTLMPVALRVIVFPLLLLSVAVSLLRFIKSRHQLYFTFFLFFIVVLLTESLGTGVNWISESYTLSIPLLFLGLACLPGFIPMFSTNDSPVLSIMTFSVILLMALVAKVSVGMILAGFAGYLSLRYHGLRWQTWFLGALMLLCLWLAAHYLTMSHVTGYDVFYLLETRNLGEHIAPLLPLLMLILCRYFIGSSIIHSIPGKLYESLWIVIAVAYLVPNVLAIHSGSGLYILDVSRWIIIWVVFVCLLVSPSINSLDSGSGETTLAGQFVHLILQRRRWLLLSVFLGICVLPQGLSAFRVFYKLRERSELAAELELHSGHFTGLFDAERPGSLLGSTVDFVVQNGYSKHVLGKLEASLTKGDSQGRTAIYVPYNNFFWRWPEACDGIKIGKRTQQQIFFFQAMAGLPVLNDWPYSKHACAYNDFLAVGGYKEEERPEGDESYNWICSDARKKGFTEILVLRGDLFDTDFERLRCHGEQ